MVVLNLLWLQDLFVDYLSHNLKGGGLVPHWLERWLHKNYKGWAILTLQLLL